MSFSENLKQIRKEYHLSQEDLAELLDVSRQAVSKWEQGQGYPEVETLLLLSKKLDISLDDLMSNESVCDRAKDAKVTGSIVITSPHENAIVTCYKIASTRKMKGGKNAPQYALFGVGRGDSGFWGEPTTFLGWYANEEMIRKEISEINKAISQGIPAYTLQYSAKTERRLASIKMIDESKE